MIESNQILIVDDKQAPQSIIGQVPIGLELLNLIDKEGEPIRPKIKENVIQIITFKIGGKI